MSDIAATAPQETHHHTRLGELAATAICGNDITSSCLYVSALAIVYAGKLAPISLLMVAAVLFLFRSIYAEVVGALPLNGGAYNALLNTTSKFRASIAACLTVLSYMATAVISALEGMHYVANIVPNFPIFYATIGLLVVFMVLSIVGITESAVVAIAPLMALLALALVAIPDVATHQNALLAHLGQVAGGERFGGTLSYLISVDAAMVLSGAVLTSFVGVTGLVNRMTLDRCLPQFLLKTNSRGTTHRIIIGFFLLCVSVLFITHTADDHDQIKKLAGIYTISFLSVMALFGLGNILLKIKRRNLPRPTQARWISVVVAVSAVLLGLVGNALIDPQYLITFLQYFVPAMLVITIMLARIALLEVVLKMVRSMTAAIVGPMTKITKWVREKIDDINAQQIVFFTRGDNIANLNNALLYVRQNEHTNRLKIVIITNEQVHLPPNLAQELDFLDQAYPEIDVEFVQKEGHFSPQLIQELSDEWGIPKNLMFIGSPGGRLPYDLAELGGVRLII